MTPHASPRAIHRTLLILGIGTVLGGCANEPLLASHAVAATDELITQALRSEVRTIVVIYAENRAFDNLYGNFPGARGLSDVIDADGGPLPAYAPQVDRDGVTILPRLPQTWGGVTASGYTPVVTQAQSAGLANAPFSIEHAFTAQSGVTLSTATVTRDLYHRFFEHQMQIDGGKNDQYAAWGDAGGLTMGHYDYSESALYALARRYVLADHFFQGAFGGSFLNHQYLVCACAPQYSHADTSPARPSIAVLDAGGSKRGPRLAVAKDSPPSALEGPPKFVKSGNITPYNYFGDGEFYAVNTMQPSYQPSGNPPAADAATFESADPLNATTLPPQSAPTIGDRLDDKRVPWTWYSGAWDAALEDGSRPAVMPRKVIYAPELPAGNPDFQPHHQPFNYYADFDPNTHAARRAAHLKDYGQLLAAIAAGRLPPVVFYKPQGNLNQHAGYASLADGDAHIAALVAKLQAGPQWQHMVIVITYDEYGGAWDHIAPPRGDALGPGTRIPALIVSPFARPGSVDHTPYDTGSILRLITRRFDLEVLPGIALRDRGLAAHGEPPMGDLTAALALRR